MHNPKVSVIIPVYKVENYLKDCLDSVISQTFEDYEVICINDGSPDKCEDILKEYAKKDKRIKVITHENKGVSAARNNGLKVAKGNYICFVDSDDEIAESFLAELDRLMNEQKADIVSCDCVQSETLPKWNSAEVNEINVWDNVFENYILGNLKIPASIWGKLFKRELIKDFVFNEDISIGEDLAYLYQTLYKAKKLVATSQKLYFYRVREDSAMNTGFSQKMVDGNVATALELKKYFSNKKMPDKLSKTLNQKIAKRIFKFCVLEPKRKDKKNLERWYEYTKSLLRKLQKEGLFQPKYLDFKNRIKSWIFLRRPK